MERYTVGSCVAQFSDFLWPFSLINIQIIGWERGSQPHIYLEVKLLLCLVSHWQSLPQTDRVAFSCFLPPFRLTTVIFLKEFYGNYIIQGPHCII